MSGDTLGGKSARRKPIACAGESKVNRFQASVLLAFAATAALAAPDEKLDKMLASGASPTELAHYVFDTQGCKTCHTVGQDGKLGYTATGKERAQGFEGTLRAVLLLIQAGPGAQVRRDGRSVQASMRVPAEVVGKLVR